MAKENSILEEALLEAKQIEEALKTNTKEILATTFKQEIGDLVKESLKEDTNKGNDLSKTKSVNEQFEDEDEVEDELGDLDIDLSDEEEGEEDEDLGEPIADAGDDVEMPELPEPEALGEPEGEEEEEMDLTGADDADVLKIFKEMSDSDQIVVVKTDDGVKIDDKETGAEYIIQGDLAESGNNESIEDLAEDEDGEPIYEIVFDETEEVTEEVVAEVDETNEDEEAIDEESEEISEDVNAKCVQQCLEDNPGDSGAQGKCVDDNCLGGSMKKPSDRPNPKAVARPERGGGKRSRRGIGEEETVEEGSRTLGSGKSHGRAGLPKPKAYSSNVAIDEGAKSNNYKALVSEVETLKSKNGEYKEALKVFRNKLNEVAIFNSNLAYATRLFTEHSTTKKEKLTVLKRFDEIETLKESKNLYRSICNELNENKKVAETIDETVNKTVTKGSANLNESTAYVDPQVMEIKSLMDRIGRR